LKNIKDNRVKVYSELDHYPTYDEQDTYLPFVEAINPNKAADDNEYIPSNIEVVSDDGHHKHIRCKGIPAEALAAMEELDGRT
jgi:hypothetical protein